MRLKMNFRHLMNFNLYRGSHIRHWKWFDVDYGVKITIATRIIVHKIEWQIHTHWWSLSRSLVNQTCPRGRIHPHKRVNLIWLSLFQFLSNFLHDSAYLMPLRAPWGAKFEQLELIDILAAWIVAMRQLHIF